MFRSSPVSSFFLFASSSPTSTPSPSNFTTINARHHNHNQHGHSTSSNLNRVKNTLPHKLITIALAINTLSLILCVCVIIVVIALTMTLSPSKSAFAYSNHSGADGNSFVRQPNFIFTSVYPLISKKLAANSHPVTPKPLANFSTSSSSSSSSSPSPSSSPSVLKRNLGSTLYKSNPLPVIPQIPRGNNVNEEQRQGHHQLNNRITDPVPQVPPPFLHPLPVLSNVSPEIQALEQAYGQILAILPLFIISSLLGVSASAKSSTTGAIILYWIILTATLLISTYITSTFVEYENLFAISSGNNNNLPRKSVANGLNGVNWAKHLIDSNTSEPITDPVDDDLTDDEDFDDVYSDDDVDDKGSNLNSNSQVECVARIIVLIGALQMISAIMLTFAKFHKTRVAIKDPSFNDLARFNNPINMTNIDAASNIVTSCNVSSSNRRLSSRGTIETSLQYYPDDGMDLINHSTTSSPSMSLNHQASTSSNVFRTNSIMAANCNLSSNVNATGNYNCVNSNGNSANGSSLVKSVYHEMHNENNNSNCDDKKSHSSGNQRASRGYFTTSSINCDGRNDLTNGSRVNNFTNYTNSIYANRVTFPEDILAIETVTCDSSTSSNNASTSTGSNCPSGLNVFPCSSSSAVKSSDSVKICLPRQSNS